MKYTVYQEKDDIALCDIASEILTEANFKKNRKGMGAFGAAQGERDANAAAQYAKEIEDVTRKPKPGGGNEREIEHSHKSEENDLPSSLTAPIGGGNERKIEYFHKKYNEEVDKLYEQTPEEQNAIQYNSARIAALLGVKDANAVEVEIGRIQNAKSIWFSWFGLQNLKAAEGNFVNAANGARMPKGVMADRPEDYVDGSYGRTPSNYYSSGSRLSGGQSYGITPTIGEFANCVEVSIDWGKAGESLDKLKKIIIDAGLDLPGKGIATQDKPKDWGKVIIWTLRYLIWQTMYKSLESVKFNVDDDVIMAVADIGDGNSAITRLRFVVNTPLQNVLRENKRLAESIGDYCLAKIDVSARKTYDKYIYEIYQKWNESSRKAYFTKAGGLLCDLLNAMSTDGALTGVNVFEVSKLPDITTNLPEEKKNSVTVQRYAEAAEIYNKRASNFKSLDEIFDSVVYNLFAELYDENRMLEEAIAARENSKYKRPGKIEFEQLDPDWTVSRYNFISARNAVDAYDTERLETAITSYDGKVKRVPSFVTGAYGMPADRRWKWANASDSEQYEGLGNGEFSRLKYFVKTPLDGSKHSAD